MSTIPGTQFAAGAWPSTKPGVVTWGGGSEAGGVGVPKKNRRKHEKKRYINSKKVRDQKGRANGHRILINDGREPKAHTRKGFGGGMLQRAKDCGLAGDKPTWKDRNPGLWGVAERPKCPNRG